MTVLHLTQGISQVHELGPSITVGLGALTFCLTTGLSPGDHRAYSADVALASWSAKLLKASAMTGSACWNVDTIWQLLLHTMT